MAPKSLFGDFIEIFKDILTKCNDRFLKGAELPIGEYMVDGPEALQDPHADPLIVENFSAIFLERFNLLQLNSNKEEVPDR